MSVKVRTTSFINPTGKLGHNKAAYIEMENKGKMFKFLPLFLVGEFRNGQIEMSHIIFLKTQPCVDEKNPRQNCLQA